MHAVWNKQWSWVATVLSKYIWPYDTDYSMKYEGLNSHTMKVLTNLEKKYQPKILHTT